MNYTPTIGLEIHAQLKTKTKLFCDSLNDSFETKPNVNICPVCMGHPGTLPATNRKAIEQIIRAGIALNCKIPEFSKFDRKNYFYPDLPKGYQISQYDMPFCEGGYIEVEKKRGSEDKKKIKIERIHLEEDAGRLVHSEDGQHTLVDFNRAGTPLMELVTRPVIKNAYEAKRFVQELRLILRYLKVSDADMEKGQMRVDVNLSLAPENATEFGEKVELKNLNSIRAVEEGIKHEIERQKKVLNAGESVQQETRGWDDVQKKTVLQRKKEYAHDYRYFPEPDIPPVRVTKKHGFDLQKWYNEMPELPHKKRDRFKKEYRQPSQVVEVFVANKNLADYYEYSVSEARNWLKARGEKDLDSKKINDTTARYIVRNLRTLIRDNNIKVSDLKITPAYFGAFIGLIYQGEISSAAARDILPVILETGNNPEHIVEEKGLKQVSDTGELESLVDDVISENESAAEDYKQGKEEALKFLMGQVMAKSKGSANPQMVTEILKNKLK